MENASKALIIAGGILLAIITLSLIVYMTTSLSRIGEAQDEKTAAEQLVAFNMEYESYNKQVMYGTEVITVANKAIDYNEGLNASNASKQIKIIIKLDKTFNSTKVTTTNYTDEREDQEDSEIVEDYSLDPGTYTIEDKTNDIVKNFFKQKAEDYELVDERVTTHDYVKVTWYYSALTNFKREIFKCTNVHYNETTGRIDEMTFERYL